MEDENWFNKKIYFVTTSIQLLLKDWKEGHKSVVSALLCPAPALVCWFLDNNATSAHLRQTQVRQGHKVKANISSLKYK